jgi:uncharacterized membrane protein YccC
VVDTAFEAVADATETVRRYLATEEGRRLRHRVATVVIVAAPLLSELPLVRRNPLARLMRTAAVGALLIKGAQWLRDWEPVPHPGVRRPELASRPVEPA